MSELVAAPGLTEALVKVLTAWELEWVDDESGCYLAEYLAPRVLSWLHSNAGSPT